MSFAPDNPPNAALVMEAEPGNIDIAVLELTNPRYDTATNTAAYEAKPLRDYQHSLEMGFQEQPTDLAQLHPTFGTAHLVIDDCADLTISCRVRGEIDPLGEFPNQGFCWHWSSLSCIPCEPFYSDEPPDLPARTVKYWNDKCNATVPACNGRCLAAWKSHGIS